jgi:hypothetical protein
MIGAYVTPTFERCIKGLTDERRAEIMEVIRRVAESYGQPHVHQGLGIRKIAKVLECRDSLGNRLVFSEKDGALNFFFYGNHDEVKRRTRRRKK